jgi:predicted NUDIX family phosphoesterase
MAEDELILAVRTSELFARRKFQGIEPGGTEYLEFIFEPRHTHYIRRSSAEEDASWKQIIPYVVLHSGGRVLTYTRGKLSGEKRLVAQRSVGLGGHIRHTDESFFAAAGPEAYRVAVQRELEEEISLPSDVLLADRIVGVINDDSIAVGKVHFGIVHIWDLSRPEAMRRETKINSPHFEDIDRLQRTEDLSSFETWSQLCLRHWAALNAQPGWRINRQFTNVEESA